MKWDLNDILIGTQGRALSVKEKKFESIGTDTRKSLQGQVFFALRGEKFDAHDFITTAVQLGATALVVDKVTEFTDSLKNQVTIIQVEDTLTAFQKLAHYWRKKNRFKVIGITGSNGKTTSKEFTRQLLTSQFKVHASEGSFNNHWGVPMTLLSAPLDSDYIVLEMGMNHAGELKNLTQISEPDIAVCTNVGRAHIGFFDNLEGIAKAKEEIYLFSPRESHRIFNLDNVKTQKMYWLAAEGYEFPNVSVFSRFNSHAQVFLQIKSVGLKSITVEGRIGNKLGLATIPVFGSQNIENILVASSIALACKMDPDDIWFALKRCQTSWGRNQLIERSGAATILFDAYNANPDSLKALLENIAQIPTEGQKVAVFGEMRELGNLTDTLHEELGEKASHVGLNRIWFIGSSHESFGRGLEKANYRGSFKGSVEFNQEEASQFFNSLGPQDQLYIKGSRGIRLEKVLDFLGIDHGKS